MTDQPNYPRQDGDVTVLGPETFAFQDGKVISWKGENYVPQQRLRLAHQARRAKEHQLDDIRRALCDIGVIEDDDPYSHADLADVIRQTAPAEPTKPDTVTDPAWLGEQYAKAIAADDGHPCVFDRCFGRRWGGEFGHRFWAAGLGATCLVRLRHAAFGAM